MKPVSFARFHTCTDYALEDMEGASESFESLDLAVLDHKFVPLPLYLERVQPPCQQVGLEEAQSAELHSQVLLLSVVIPLLGVQQNLLSVTCLRGLLRAIEPLGSQGE